MIFGEQNILKNDKGAQKKMVYDTKKFVEKKLPKAGTKQEGKIKNRTVYTRKIRTKKGIAYVDRLGRRASVKKKKLHKTK